jgi:hypothetical protein
LRSSEKELSEARNFFRNFAKPQLYEGRPKGELCATVVQPQRVVQKARAASLLYNEQVLLQVWNSLLVLPGTAAQ